MREIAAFRSLPFQMGSQTSPSNAPFPEHLPLTLARDETSGLLIQAPNPEVRAWLEKVYRVAEPYGTPMREDGLGRRYAEDFLEYIQESVGRTSLAGLRVVEIGCGYGYLLKRLLESGADAIGIEPGPGGARARAAGLPVINAPFASSQIDAPVDIFVAYGVLEHIQDYHAFLIDQRRCLASGGQIIFSVPDCAWPIAKGDISMLVHEHWNYFTTASLSAIAGPAGFAVKSCRTGGVGATIYSTWKKALKTIPVEQASTAGEEFVASYNAAAAFITSVIAAWVAEDKSIGIYVPGRILNYLPLLESFNCRFFDDDPNLMGRYYPHSIFPSRIARHC